MGHFVRSLLKGLSALVFLAGLALGYAPATATEEAALGPEPQRLHLVQMRLAKASMTLMPDRSVKVMADATGVPEAQVREVLLALAEGRAPTPSVPTEAASAAGQPDPATGRRIDAGGALFVTPPDSN